MSYELFTGDRVSFALELLRGAHQTGGRCINFRGAALMFWPRMTNRMHLFILDREAEWRLFSVSVWRRRWCVISDESWGDAADIFGALCCCSRRRRAPYVAVFSLRSRKWRNRKCRKECGVLYLRLKSYL